MPAATRKSQSLIAPALTACSFEAQEWAWNALTDGRANDITGEHSAGGHSRPDAWVGVDELPEWLEAESLADAIEHLESADVEARIAAAQSLAQYPARRSVDALTAILVRDENPAVRAAAVTSLAAMTTRPSSPQCSTRWPTTRARCARRHAPTRQLRPRRRLRRLAETGDRERWKIWRGLCQVGDGGAGRRRLASEDGVRYEAFSMLCWWCAAGEGSWSRRSRATAT